MSRSRLSVVWKTHKMWQPIELHQEQRATEVESLWLWKWFSWFYVRILDNLDIVVFLEFSSCVISAQNALGIVLLLQDFLYNRKQSLWKLYIFMSNWCSMSSQKAVEITLLLWNKKQWLWKLNITWFQLMQHLLLRMLRLSFSCRTEDRVHGTHLMHYLLNRVLWRLF